MMNLCVFIGTVSGVPEWGLVGKNDICKFSIATTRHWRDKDGHRESEVTFIDCVAWQAMAKNCKKFVRRGELVMVKGRLTQDKWETKSGEKRRTVSITVENLQYLGKRGGKGE